MYVGQAVPDVFNVIGIFYPVLIHSQVTTRCSRISPECGPRQSLTRVLAKRGYNRSNPERQSKFSCKIVAD